MQLVKFVVCVCFHAGKRGTCELCSDESHRGSGRGRQRCPEAWATVLQAPLRVHEGGTKYDRNCVALVCFCLARVFLFAQCDCNACSFVSHTGSCHAQRKDPHPSRFWCEKTPASSCEDESPSLGPPVLIKRPGVLLTLPLQGHCSVVFGSFFAWLRIKADNS